MTFEKLNEPIEAIAHFNGKTIYLLKFKWKNRAYKVVKTVHKWTEREGQIKTVHFKSLADLSDLWRIIRTYLRLYLIVRRSNGRLLMCS